MEGPPPGATGDIVGTPPSRRCDTCGAPVRFDPAHGDLRCRHCRGQTAIEAAGGPPAELDYEAVVGADRSTAPLVEAVRMQCADCGAPSDYPANTLAATCPYCRTPFVGAPWSSRPLTPGALVPLSITEDQARANTKAWLGSRWFAPRHLDKVATGALRSGYTPAWVFSMATVAAYTGQRGDNYLDTETYTTTDSNGNTTTQTRTVTKIRWSSASGTVDLRFRDVLAFAGTDPLSRFGEELEPWALDGLQPYRDDLLRGTTAQVYTAPPAAGLGRARERTTDAVEDAIRDDIGGDHQRIDDVDRRDHDVAFRYVLLPGWEATYQHRGDTFQVAVNGRTGEVDGTRPYSKIKIAMAVAAVIALIALIAFFVIRSSSSTSTPTSTTRPPTTQVAPTTRPPTTAEPVTPTTPTTATSPTTATTATTATDPTTTDATTDPAPPPAGPDPPTTVAPGAP